MTEHSLLSQEDSLLLADDWILIIGPFEPARIFQAISNGQGTEAPTPLVCSPDHSANLDMSLSYPPHLSREIVSKLPVPITVGVVKVQLAEAEEAAA